MATKTEHSKSSAEQNLKKEFGEESVDPRRSHPVFQHIRDVWPKLIFDHEDLLLGGAANPLIYHEKPEDGKSEKPFFIYISDKEDVQDITNYYAEVKEGILKKIEDGTLPEEKLKKYNENGILNIEVRRIPRDENGNLTIPYDEHGLLHTEKYKRAISPGLERFPKGIIFNWDTAFIIRGLVQDGYVDLAKELTEVMLYEIEHYNGILNANATFCLTDNPKEPRCQPPFIASKVLMIYNLWDELEYPPEESREDWLKRALPLVENHINFWTDPNGCHFDSNTGLSKYGSTYGKPAVEALHAEPEHFKRAYQDLCHLYDKHVQNPLPVSQRDYQGRKDAYYVEMFLELDDKGIPVPFAIKKEEKTLGEITIEVYSVQGLTPAYFDGDIAMRESGLDATRRFGFMAADANNLAASDLNCFIKKMQGDTAQSYRCLVEAEPDNPHWKERSDYWQQKSENLAQHIRDEMWDDAAPQFEGDNPQNPDNPMPPCYRDRYLSPLAEKYNLGKFRRFNFSTQGTSALWAGIATQEQAHTIINEVYPLFLDPKGFSLSNHYGYMWDKRKTFSPSEEIAAEGAELYNYYHISHYMRSIRKIAIEEEFMRTGQVWEKMETIHGTCNTAQYQAPGVGYDHNDPGFGWTNAEYIDACMAIPRLELKIKGDYIPPPCISSNFVILDHGVASPPVDNPQMLSSILEKAQARLKKELPELEIDMNPVP
ncbi:MAG: trehalase family glycosidase [Alphaproteobacteria bacterium]